jgi:hypothetical protein
MATLHDFNKEMVDLSVKYITEADYIARERQLLQIISKNSEEARLTIKDATPDFARGFRAGERSVLRTNRSGCCCKWDDRDEGTIVSLCAAHKEIIDVLTEENKRLQAMLVAGEPPYYTRWKDRASRLDALTVILEERELRIVELEKDRESMRNIIIDLRATQLWSQEQYDLVQEENERLREALNTIESITTDTTYDIQGIAKSLSSD